MKTILTTFFFSLFLFPCVGQNLVKSEKFKISFETSDKLPVYDTGSENVLGYENDDYAVDIEMVPYDEESEDFLNDVKYGAREIAEDMAFKVIKDGGKIANIDKAYYVITYDDNELKIPVFVIAILNDSSKTAYEITVYCYNSNLVEGEKITKSFKIW